jgi:hypothetical protein
MKKTLILAAACLVASLTGAAPIRSGHLQRGRVLAPALYLGGGIEPQSMFNPRYFGGKTYANQINEPCFGRYAAGSVIPEVAIDNSTLHTNEHRMVLGFPGAYSSTYMIGSSSGNGIGGTFTTTTFTRYNWDGSNPVVINSVDNQRVDTFDWADDDTIITIDYTSPNRSRLYLVDVTAEPFAMTRNTNWNENGYVTVTGTTSIRNVRVGQVYSGYAYFGDYTASSPKLYAINLATGIWTELGNPGVLSGGGIWNAVERGGYLFVHTPLDGIFVYTMTDATTLGALYTRYTKAELDACTGYIGLDPIPQYYGLDVSPDLKTMVIGAAWANVFELQEVFPVQSGNWQLGVTVAPKDTLGQQPNTTYNPRYFDGDIFATEISGPTFRCFGRFHSGSSEFLAGAIPTQNEHRMLGLLRGAGSTKYLLGTGGWDGVDPATTFLPTFTRYDLDGSNPVIVNSIDDQVVETFDWVDADTMVSTCYMSGQRKKIYLTDVVADPFASSRNTTWNADGYVTTDVTTRIRNVRVGQVYSGYAYYGDAGQNSNPNFYALNLATGESTLLGNAGTLTGSGSFGLWTVVERGGYLYVQTTDNDIQVYNMVDGTTLGALYTAYSKAELDAATGYTGQYYGMDVYPDLTRMVLGAAQGNVYELAPALRLTIVQAGSSVRLSWPAYYQGYVFESSSDLSVAFTEMDPQPTVSNIGTVNTATVPLSGTKYFRLRK